MKPLFIIIFFLHSSFLYSQYTITSEKIPVAGDKVFQIKADTISISPGAMGDNAVWDYSLSLSNDTLVTFYVNINTTPVAESFPNSNLASFVTQKNINIYTYYQTAINELSYIGTANYSKSYIFSIPFQNPKTIFKYPFKYKDTINNDYNFFLESAGVQNFFYGNYSMKYDSFGKIKINDKEYECMRLHSVDYYGDSENFKESKISWKIDSYQWFIKESKFPLFSISYTDKKSKQQISSFKEVYLTVSN